MKKLLPTVLATFCAFTCLATDYYWQGASTAPTGGNWNSASNWTLADGTTATDYPHLATDVAIFNGIIGGERTYVTMNVACELAELRFADGCTPLRVNKSFHVAELTRQTNAVIVGIPDGYNRADPADWTVGNRDDVLINGGLLPGAYCVSNGDRWEDYQSVSIKSDNNVIFKSCADDRRMWYNIAADDTWSNPYALIFGNYGDDRDITFVTECTLTLPTAEIVPISVSHVGSRTGDIQGTIDSCGNALYLWPRYHHTTYYRPINVAPAFVVSGYGTALYFADHSSETCEYMIPSGTFQLGTNDVNCAELLQTCRLGSGAVKISWSGELDVQCANALNPASAVYMTSYNGRGAKFGKITMNENGTVNKLYFDGKSQAAGTYGATGSGAANIDDVRFAGTGVLTVRHDDCVHGTVIIVQ